MYSSPLSERTYEHKGRRLRQLLEIYEAYERIGLEKIQSYDGKRNTKNKERALEDWRRDRDTLFFLRELIGQYG